MLKTGFIHEVSPAVAESRSTIFDHNDGCSPVSSSSLSVASSGRFVDISDFSVGMDSSGRDDCFVREATLTELILATAVDGVDKKLNMVKSFCTSDTETSTPSRIPPIKNIYC
jgi:hypothetical protein